MMLLHLARISSFALGLHQLRRSVGYIALRGVDAAPRALRLNNAGASSRPVSIHFALGSGGRTEVVLMRVVCTRMYRAVDLRSPYRRTRVLIICCAPRRGIKPKSYLLVLLDARAHNIYAQPENIVLSTF